MKRIGVGVLGYGRIGRLHAGNVREHPDAELVGVADPRFSEEISHPPDVRATSAGEELLTDDRVEAVLICSPTATHAGWIEAAAAHGKAIFCEKPIDLDPMVARRALAAVERAAVPFQVGFNRRFDPSFAKLRRLIHDGEIGSLAMLRILSRDPAPPPIEYVRDSGGIFLDMMIHDFDMVRYLSGEEVVEVHARGAARIDPQIAEAGDVDLALVSLRLASGSLAVIENSRAAAYGYDQRIEAFGSLQAAEATHRTATSTRLKGPQGVRTERPYDFFTDRYREAFRAELDAFLGAVRHGRAVPVSGRDGLAPLWIAAAAQRSLASGLPEAVEEPTDAA